MRWSRADTPDAAVTGERRAVAKGWPDRSKAALAGEKPSVGSRSGTQTTPPRPGGRGTGCGSDHHSATMHASGRHTVRG